MSAVEKDPLEDELMKRGNRWVGILQTEHRVVVSGDTAYEAKVEAEKNGCAETALFMVQPPGRYHIFRLS